MNHDFLCVLTIRSTYIDEPVAEIVVFIDYAIVNKQAPTLVAGRYAVKTTLIGATTRFMLMPPRAEKRRENEPYFIYAGIRVRELRRSLRFYHALGLKTMHRGTMRHKGVFVWLRDPRTKYVLELNYYPRGSRFHERYTSGSELDHLGFTVRDVEPLLARLRKVGVQRAVANFCEGNMRLTFVKDPDGIWLEFLSWTSRGRKLNKGAPVIDWIMPKSNRG
jgi:catechol 2,3-dioxygenase-like lactoylglutathione lyase family enzyme